VPLWHRRIQGNISQLSKAPRARRARSPLRSLRPVHQPKFTVQSYNQDAEVVHELRHIRRTRYAFPQGPESHQPEELISPSDAESLCIVSSEC